MNVTVPVTKEALERSFQFAINFHLDPTKGQVNRTTGQSRGLGGVVDSFMLGKVIESSVVDILNKTNPNKEYILDFEVHNAGDADPDIIKIREEGEERPPKVFVEIKNTGDTDRWIGTTEEQFQTIKRNTIVGDNLKDIYIIYASIKNQKQRQIKKDDLLGVYLKFKTNSSIYRDFSDFNDLFVDIDLIITGQELMDHGTRFEKNYYFYETEIFRQVVMKNTNGFLPYKSNILPKFRYIKSFPYPEKFGELEFEGKIEIWKKENVMSNRMYIRCITDVDVSNKVIGRFHLERNNLYEYMPCTVGRNPILSRNNIWIAKRNAKNLIKPAINRMQEIAQKI